MAKTKAVEVTMDKMPNMLHLDESELPEIKDWKVGEKYQILLDVEQTGLHKGDPMQGNKKFSADFKIVKASMPDEGSAEEEKKESPEVEAEEEATPKVAEALRRKFAK